MVYVAECLAVRKRSRGNCTQLKCACCGGQEEIQDVIILEIDTPGGRAKLRWRDLVEEDMDKQTR